MVRIGTVWDRTIEVIGGRTAMIGGIAVATLLVPTVLRDAWTAYMGTGAGISAGARATGGILTLIATVVMVYGQLAITAVASDPATTRAQAYRIAARRLGVAIAIILVALVAVVIASIPLGVLLAGAGFDFQAAAMRATQRAVSPGGMAGAALYMIALGIVFIVIAARLAVLWPVIVNERIGLTSFARAFRLTRGLTWKLIGVILLYAIVLVVALAATTSIVGVVFRLALGAENIATATFLAAIAGAVVTTIFAVLQTVFAAQLYVLRRDDGQAVHPTP